MKLPPPALCLLFLASVMPLAVADAVRAPSPYRVPAQLPDAADMISPGSVRITGWLGTRVAANATNRLATVDLEPLLAGFRQKPGSHPWIGEHIGKWLHAATLAWANTGDPGLRRRLDYAAAELVKAQEPDGYVGTYVPGKRFGLYEGADWDVWSHKYCLIGLLTYHQFTGDPDALTACRKAGDLLVRTFPRGGKSLVSAGTHMGMAATSVLEPMVLLYRSTGERRYLEFCEQIVEAWSAPDGPHIVEALLTKQRVDQTANGKAYEMLSNLVGLCELARATGKRAYLVPVENAWNDIVSRRLYLTGSASQAEHFHEDYALPNGDSAHVAETCVTTTWIQLNLQLLRLTGEARFGHELEKTFYNHLAAAQHPRGGDWCYFTPLEGRKAYLSDINCCHSSGPRGMALVAAAAAFTYHQGKSDGIALNLLEVGSLETQLQRHRIHLAIQSRFPRDGQSIIRVEPDSPATFALRLRVPTWTQALKLSVNRQPVRVRGVAGWLEIPPRRWKSGDQVEVSCDLKLRWMDGAHGNAGKAAWTYGPFVLAYDDKRNAGLPKAWTIGLEKPSGTEMPPLFSGADLAVVVRARGTGKSGSFNATLVPFADAGRDGGAYRVWLRSPDTAIPQDLPLLAGGQESRSRQGNVDGSINDADPGTFAVTFNGQPAKEDWYAVALDEPVAIRRIVFTQGNLFHDGGWFDASAAKPRVEVKREAQGVWETLGTLDSYPATSAADRAGLASGQRYELKLSQPVRAVAVRVIGKPASGDNPAQAFSSCAELEAYAE